MWVLNGSGRHGRGRPALRVPELPRHRRDRARTSGPDTSGLNQTTIRAYNGAETQFPLTVAALKLVFGVEVEPVTDPAVRVDFVIITGANPAAHAPAGP